MPGQRVLEIGTDVNIELFSAYLWQQGIAHRVFEEQGRQVVEVGDADAAAAVREQFGAWREGRIQLERADTPAVPDRGSRIVAFATNHPVLATFLLVTLVCYPATWPLRYGEFSEWAAALSFVPIGLADGRPVSGALGATLASGQLWRLVTPIFLHFSVAHLLFNLAVVAEFGRRIERGVGSVALAALIGVIAITSNLAQYLATGPGLFGGASGVAYGLVGFVVVRARLQPDERIWQVNRSFAVAVLVCLVIMTTGITELFGLYIANAAHWTGLLVGAALGLVRARTRG